MCAWCKKYGLDHTTVSANLNYVLNQASSEKECFNGMRDTGRNTSGVNGGGMRLDDFMKLTEAVETGLSRAQVVALRLYTSHIFNTINDPLRDTSRTLSHPLPAITHNIQTGIRRMRALNAEDNTATEEINFWRGFADMKVTDEFLKSGGTEFAPMSTTTNPRVAVGYAVRKGETNASLLMKIITTNNLQRGANLKFLSVFPDEDETLFPPLTYLQPNGNQQVIEYDGIKLTVVEVATTLP